jgi:enamine deaminase RidA (YjgF/YER057c/UK114 family)
MNDIVHLTVYLTDMREFPRLGEIARQYLRDPFPGMTLIGVKELAWPDLLVEIQAIVGVPRKGA